MVYAAEKHIDVLVDVRRNPKAWSAIWSKPSLKQHLPANGVTYYSAPELGNVSGTTTWVPPDEGHAEKALQELATIAQNKTLALMCAELDSTRCHRTPVATELSRMTGLPVEHLP